MQADNHKKRFRKGRQRPLFLLDQDAEEDDEQDDLQEDDSEDVQDPDGAGEADWDSLAFVQRKSFAPCTTPFCKERNIAHTHSTDRQRGRLQRKGQKQRKRQSRKARK